MLADAADRGFLSLSDVIERLKQTSFRYPERLADRLLDEEERRQ